MSNSAHSDDTAGASRPLIPTQAKRAAVRALEADQLLSAIVDSSDDAIIGKDLNGIITSWNKSAETLLGYSAEEIIGRPVNILIPHDRQDEEPSIMERVRNGQRVVHYETVRRRKDGSLVDVLLTVSPVKDSNGDVIGASKVLRDISERKVAERNRYLLSAIVESSDDAIASKDLNGIITSWNKAAERLLGYKADEIIGKSVTTLIPADRIDEEPAILSRIRRGERIDHYHTVRQRKDGSLVDVSLTVSPIKDGKGRVIGASKILRDITEVVRARERLEQTVALRTAQLRETVAELEAFSYSIAHDMRAPLRAMQTYSRLLEEDYGQLLPKEGNEFLGRIAAGANRLDRLITDVLNYTKISRGEMDLEALELNSLIEEVIGTYPDLNQHAARISVQPNIPPVLANGSAMMQVISNLLSNALKFVPKGKTPEVRISVERREHCVRLWVKDNGIGISEEGKKRIFNMFQRLNPANAFEGTGIGLTIIRKAVERMGGSVGVESEPGVGSRFWIELRSGR